MLKCKRVTFFARIKRKHSSCYFPFVFMDVDALLKSLRESNWKYIAPLWENEWILSRMRAWEDIKKDIIKEEQEGSTTVICKQCGAEWKTETYVYPELGHCRVCDDHNPNDVANPFNFGLVNKYFSKEKKALILPLNWKPNDDLLSPCLDFKQDHECCVCTETLTCPIFSICKHACCVSCVAQFKQATCPLCRDPIREFDHIKWLNGRRLEEQKNRRIDEEEEEKQRIKQVEEEKQRRQAEEEWQRTKQEEENKRNDDDKRERDGETLNGSI